LAAALGLLILVALGVHSCQLSQRNSALKNYNGNVASLIRSSDATGHQLFTALSSAQASGGATGLQSQINQTALSAENQLRHSHTLDVPDEAKSAQQNLVLTLQMRRDGITNIAQQIQPALGTSTRNDAVGAIAVQTARFYASDVVYKGYTLPLIVAALHDAGIAVGGSSGEAIEAGQFLPDIQWLTPSYIASQLHVSGGDPPGAGGHSLDSVSVNGTALDSGSTNTLPANPPPTFTFKVTNTGQSQEQNVVCKVTVAGSGISAQTTIPQTAPGQQSSCQVTLSSAPPAGSDTVTATVQPVSGEQRTSDNSLSFPVTFQ